MSTLDTAGSRRRRRSATATRDPVAQERVEVARNEVQKPTEAEIELLKVMWERGPCTVRDIHEALQTAERQTAYTTTLKLLQVMHAKGLVIRDESQRAHRFAATVSREATERAFVGALISKLFDGSATRLVMQALGNDPRANESELAEIRQLLRNIEQERD
ncbi:MAG: BlaI/MecI/CopY family transcriptional regulator [Rhodanobacteraceae bacterium]|nr:BlaI/MecI/CopY family transcriptional regulator [Rhodanobacteraceae bacterium]